MARKQSKSSYNLEWYNRYRNALKYFGIDIKELKHPTSKHVSQARSQWQGTRTQMKRKGWVDLPSVYQASAMVTSAPQIDTQYTDYLTSYLPQLIQQIESKDYSEIQRYESGKRAVNELDSFKNHMVDILTWGRAKVNNDKILAQAISSSPFVERALNTIEYYTRTNHQMDAIAYVDDVVTPVLEQAINDALASVIDEEEEGQL